MVTDEMHESERGGSEWLHNKLRLRLKWNNESILSFWIFSARLSVPIIDIITFTQLLLVCRGNNVVKNNDTDISFDSL